MAQSLLLYCYTNIIRSLYVHPSKEGATSIVQSLGVLGTITASGIGMGYMKQWISIDPLVLLKWPGRRFYSHEIGLRGTSTTTKTNTSYETNHNIMPPTGSSTSTGSHLSQFSQTFLRVLFVPSFCEEMIWRGILLPPVVPSSSIFNILVVNVCYTLSHVIHAKALSLLRHPSIRHIINKDDKYNSQNNNNRSDSADSTTTSIEMTIKVFTDPSFLFMTFVLGNVCSYSYIKAGYALYAPVLIHSISVSIWLSYLGGNQALGRSS